MNFSICVSLCLYLLYSFLRSLEVVSLPALLPLTPVLLQEVPPAPCPLLTAQGPHLQGLGTARADRVVTEEATVPGGVPVSDCQPTSLQEFYQSEIIWNHFLFLFSLAKNIKLHYIVFSCY